MKKLGTLRNVAILFIFMAFGVIELMKNKAPRCLDAINNILGFIFSNPKKEKE